MKRLIILLGVFLVATIGCGHTVRNPPMLQDQAGLIRSNWENLKIGMSVEEVKNLIGPPTVCRIKTCDCSECVALGAVPQEMERQWFVYEPAQDPNVFKRRDNDSYFYISLMFRHGKLLGGRAETNSGDMLLK